MGATVTSATGVTVEADGTNAATATSSALNIAGLGSLADLSVDSRDHLVGGCPRVDRQRRRHRAAEPRGHGHRELARHRHRRRRLRVRDLGLAINILKATAVLGGGTKATVGDGATVKAASLTMTANSNTLAPQATCTSSASAGSRAAVGATAHATVSHAVETSIGTSTTSSSAAR